MEMKKPSQQKQLHENHNQTRAREWRESKFFFHFFTGIIFFFSSFPVYVLLPAAVASKTRFFQPPFLPFWDMFKMSSATIVKMFHPLEIIMWMPSVFAICAIKSVHNAHGKWWRSMTYTCYQSSQNTHIISFHNNQGLETMYTHTHISGSFFFVVFSSFSVLIVTFLITMSTVCTDDKTAGTSRYFPHVNT